MANIYFNTIHENFRIYKIIRKNHIFEPKQRVVGAQKCVNSLFNPVYSDGFSHTY